MAYITDPDLEFLGTLSDDDLDQLFNYLVYDSDGKARRTESITSSELYKKHSPHHSRYWKLLAEELQYFGGNTLANTLRGSGVLYKEILIDVANKFIGSYVKDHPDATTQELELQLITSIIRKNLPSLKGSIEEILRNNSLDSNDYADMLINAVKSDKAFISFITSRSFSVVVTNLLVGIITQTALRSIGVRVGMTAVAGRGGSMVFGPVGWVLTGAYTAVFDVAGPAFRVTIPAVFWIGILRLKNSKS